MCGDKPAGRTLGSPNDFPGRGQGVGRKGQKVQMSSTEKSSPLYLLGSGGGVEDNLIPHAFLYSSLKNCGHQRLRPFKELS